MNATPIRIPLSTRRSALSAVLLALAVLLGGSSALAESAPPDGFGALKFLMSSAEAEKAEPKLARVGDPAAATSAAQSEVPTFLTYSLANQKVIGLEGCDLQVRFADDQLYFINVNCGGQPEVMAKLIETYGEPMRTEVNAHYWFGEEHAVSVNIRSSNFGYFERKIDRGVQQALFNAVNQKPPGQ